MIDLAIGTNGFTMLAAVLGGLVVAVAERLQTRSERVARRKSVLFAIAAEIGSLVALVRVNGYSAMLRQQGADIRDPLVPSPKPLALQASHNYFSVFEANAGFIGEIDPQLATLVVGFYQMGRSLADTLHRDELADWALMRNSEQAETSDLIADRLDRWCALGDDILTRMKAVGVTATIRDRMERLLADPPPPQRIRE